MTLFYFAAICPQERFDTVYSSGQVAPAYRFNKLLAEGFAAVPGVHVRCLLSVPFQQKESTGELRSEENGVVYIQVKKKKCRFKTVQYIAFVCSSLKQIKCVSKQEETILFCDALGISSAWICVLARRILKLPAIAIITDLPQYMGLKQREKLLYRMKAVWKDRISTALINQFDDMVYLTRYMADVFKKKPFVVMEGLCNANIKQMAGMEKKIRGGKKICMYAGALHRQYGIDLLVDAFLEADMDDCELHIYGTGNYRSQIEGVCRHHDNVIYGGMLGYEEILQKECEATLLVNPRTSSEAYTRYSFPSKTLEYMASGTPVLMTRLPGLPEEYYPYLYLFEEESVRGYAAALKEVLGNSEDVLAEKGKQAQEFVLGSKNAFMQAKKILEAFGFAAG